MQDNDLDDLLDGPPEGSKPARDAQPEPAPEPVAAQPEPTGENDHDTAPPADVKSEVEPDYVPRRAVLDERRKRQNLENKLRELEARLHQPTQQYEPQQAPDWYAEPEQAAAALQAEVQHRMYQTAVYQSEMIMRDKHADYDEVSQLFAEAAQQDFNLALAVFQHPFPAEYAYAVGKQIMLMQEIGNDPGAYRAKLEAEILAKHGLAPGEAPRPQQVAPKADNSVPRSLGRAVSQQPRNSRGQFEGPASLDELLG